MKVEFESELQKAKQNLDLERQNVRETLDSEYQGERDRLKSEIKLLRSLLHAEETKNAELSGRNKQATEYAEDLESRLVASEVEKEELQVEVTRLKQEAEDMKLKHEEEFQREVQAREQLETTSKEGQKTVEAYKGDMLRHVEEAKYEMFRQLMDVFEKERAVLEKAHARTQELLTLAAKVGYIVLRCGCVFDVHSRGVGLDAFLVAFVCGTLVLPPNHCDSCANSLPVNCSQDVMYLTQKNQELTSALSQAIHYEPSINPHARYT
jgi:hypothetical protein